MKLSLLKENLLKMKIIFSWNKSNFKTRLENILENPGDAGLPPELSWKNINNINKIEFLFPKPKAFNFFRN